jgi:hypothetical protein
VREASSSDTLQGGAPEYKRRRRGQEQAISKAGGDRVGSGCACRLYLNWAHLILGNASQVSLETSSSKVNEYGTGRCRRQPEGPSVVAVSTRKGHTFIAELAAKTG